MSSDVMIEASALTKRFGSLRALDKVSFEVHRGEVVGFLGPNGAGKSTTMRILTCFISASGGTAKVHGFDVFDDPLEVRRRIGYLPQRAPLYGEMNKRSTWPRSSSASSPISTRRWPTPARPSTSAPSAVAPRCRQIGRAHV